MAKTFRCTIVTPSASVFDDEVTYVSLPAWDGQLGVMTGQSPVLTRLGIDALRVDDADGASRWFLVDGGFAQMDEGVLTILTERATPSGDLSAEEAEAALAAANTKVTQPDVDRSRVEADQQRARATRRLAARG